MTCSVACSITPEGRPGDSSHGVRVGVSPKIRREDGLAGLSTPLVVLSAGGMHCILVLLPALQKQQLGFCFFGILLSIIRPNCTAHSCMPCFVFYSFLIFCCSRRHLSGCKQCCKESQVPASLNNTAKL